MSERFEVCAEGGCPIAEALAVVGGKWKIEIVWWLQDRERRFNELRQLMPGVTQKMLTQQLRELEADGIIRREVFAQVPPKVVYSLTPLGQSLRGVLKSLSEWSVEHRAEITHRL